MDEASLAPAVPEPGCDVHAYRERLFRRQPRLSFHARLDRFALDVLHRKPVDPVCFAGGVNLHQIGVIQGRRRDRFVVSALHVLGL